MPQASDELRAKFPNGDGEAHDVLIAAGWTGPSSDGSWTYAPPSTKTHIEITEREWDAIDYLAAEWDYGGVAAPDGWYPSGDEVEEMKLWKLERKDPVHATTGFNLAVVRAPNEERARAIAVSLSAHLVAGDMAAFGDANKSTIRELKVDGEEAWLIVG